MLQACKAENLGTESYTAWWKVQEQFKVPPDLKTTDVYIRAIATEQDWYLVRNALQTLDKAYISVDLRLARTLLAVAPNVQALEGVISRLAPLNLGIWDSVADAYTRLGCHQEALEYNNIHKEANEAKAAGATGDLLGRLQTSLKEKDGPAIQDLWKIAAMDPYGISKYEYLTFMNAVINLKIDVGAMAIINHIKQSKVPFDNKLLKVALLLLESKQMFDQIPDLWKSLQTTEEGQIACRIKKDCKEGKVPPDEGGYVTGLQAATATLFSVAREPKCTRLVRHIATELMYGNPEGYTIGLVVGILNVAATANMWIEMKEFVKKLEEAFPLGLLWKQYKPILTCCGKNGDIEYAISLLKKLESKNMNISTDQHLVPFLQAVQRGTMLSGTRQGRHSNEKEQRRNQFKQQELPVFVDYLHSCKWYKPDGEAYEELLACCAKAENVELTLTLFEKMEAQLNEGLITVTPRALEPVVSLYAKKEKWSHVEDSLEWLSRHRIPVDARYMAHLLLLFARGGRVSVAEKILQIFARQKLDLRTEIAHAVALMYAEAKDVKKCIQFLQLAKRPPKDQQLWKPCADLLVKEKCFRQLGQLLVLPKVYIRQLEPEVQKEIEAHCMHLRNRMQ
eukprot:TRINITY_DN66611_c1_g1_i1.p1 TRINITY_DN66611_c1_g1~~TRINITY_DN66611_c1_g1_i1.p1  ORF type:complete len:728 (+),score=53.44 TRINITY_DN66611_c1_g1_i1:319-2184(+)